jgi:hypothetical protein
LNSLRQIFGFINSPVYECLIPARLFEMGIGNVVVARKSHSGRLGVGFFLLDVFCLGVKNTFFRTFAEEEFEQIKLGRFGSENLIPLQPACARKLVEGAVAYARELGIPAHKDYRFTQKILLNIDPAGCSAVFQYGQDNKPLFVAGPHDTEARCQHIMNLLLKKCGVNGFHYLLPEGEIEDFEDDGFV